MYNSSEKYQSAPVLVSADRALWRCRKPAVQAAHILVPASRMSTGRGILPSYLGLLCWCNFFDPLPTQHVSKNLQILPNSARNLPHVA